jgi:conjugative relaxase-like TrwC/TraI family protein
LLTISKPLSSGQAQTYHAKEFISAEQNYWRQGTAIVGEWQGKLAEGFGIAGAVDAEHFARLGEGQNPTTGEQLVRHRTGQAYTTADGTTVKPVEHRAGWDATFSAPKSVSLTALVGGDERVRKAHRQAVTTALTELERYTQARIGGNHAAETTGKFIAAKFEHDTARPVDGYAAPQLHTHAVIFNLTEREDGSIRALQPKSLFDSQQFATAVYQSELTYQLRNLGYQIEAGKSGAPEIKGYSQEYLDASSPRRQQIEEAIARSGFSGPEAAQIAAHNTRDKKKIHTPAEVMAAHRQIAAQYGNPADRIVREAHERAARQEQNRVPDAAQRAQEAITYAKARNFEREAVADQRDIIRDALRRGMGDLTFHQVRENFDQRYSTGEFQIVSAQKHDTGPQFTTPETIAAERWTVEHMRRGQNVVAPIMSEKDAASHAATREFLNPAQRRVIEEILTSRDRIHGLQGLAGTGKTTTLETIREGAERHGYAVAGLAPTSRAARQLHDAGIPADTLQAHLARGTREQAQSNPDDPANRHLYMLDESSLAGTRQMRDFLDRLGPSDRVLLIGDTRQHQGVEAGKPFEQLQYAGMRTVQLDQIVRQKDPELLKAVEHLARSETQAGITMLQSQGRITEVPNPQERIAAIAKDYAANPQGTLIVSPDNASRREINQAVRMELQARGVLGKENVSVPVLVARNDMSGADRAWAASYNPGDTVQYVRGSKHLGVEKNSYATVVATDPKSNMLTIQKAGGQRLSYDPMRLRGVNVYTNLPREFSTGDRIQFTQNNKDLDVHNRVHNRDLGRIERIGKDNSLTVKMDNGKTIHFDPAYMRHFDHGYAVTSHSSQGLTENRVIVNMDTEAPAALLNPRFAYVSISRASQDARIYTNDAATLGERLSADVTKTSAVDFQQRAAHSQPQVPNEHTKQQNCEVKPERSVQQKPQLTAQLAEHNRHYGPIETALRSEARGYDWKHETAGIQSYRHHQTGGWLHIDGQGQFFDRNAHPISKDLALESARHFPCPDCQQQRELQVLKSPAGYYVGTRCDCGPYSRDSDYYKTHEDAAQALASNTFGPQHSLAENSQSLANGGPNSIALGISL